jgi:flagellar biosynthesis regulator FlaF
MYQFAYSAIVEELTPPLLSRNRKLTKAIELIEAADFFPPSRHERLQLLSDFRRLWLSVANDLLHASHDLPEASQQGLLADAQTVLNEIECRRFQTSNKSTHSS